MRWGVISGIGVDCHISPKSMMSGAGLPERRMRKA